MFSVLIPSVPVLEIPTEEPFFFGTVWHFVYFDSCSCIIFIEHILSLVRFVLLFLIAT